MADERLLSYGDVVLRRSDLELLRGPCFLNDRLIEFFFAQLTSTCPPSILLVPPALTFWILHCPDFDSLHSSIDPLHLSEREMVIFAMNNNGDVESAGGGTHWSLLVYYRIHNRFEHFDSMGGMNSKLAKEFVSIIKRFLGSDAACTKLEEPWTPQQENGYDCGVYVMAIAQALCQAYVDGLKSSIEYRKLLRNRVTPDMVSNMRRRTSDLIISLANEQSRS